MIEIRTGRPATLARRGMVTSPHSLASAAGVDVLRAGGSVVDAAIATSAVLGVIYPHMTGLGGDAFWLINDAKQNKVRFLDGGGRASRHADLMALKRQGLSEIPFRGVLPATLTTPGAVSSWDEAHKAYGRLPLKRVLASAIDYAREGFVITPRVAGWLASCQADLMPHAYSRRLFLPDGPLKAGSVLVNAGLARTLEAIATDGASGFYRGETGRMLAAFSAGHGGVFDAEDLAAQHAFWADPIRGTYRDLTLYETPAPTQGFTVIQMLQMLESYDLRSSGYLSPEHVHLLVQAKQIAYHDRDRFLADPRFVDVPMQRLIDPSYAAQRRGLIDPNHALPWDRVPSYGSLTGDTIYLAVADAEGNAVSLIQSLYGAFGSAVVAGETGVVLQNRSAYFSLDPDHPNRLEAGKTPMHTLIASMGFRDERLWSVLGCMGADGQPQIQLQAYVAMLDYDCDIQQALETPRWLSGRFALGESRDTLHIESRFQKETIDALEARGHLLNRWGAWNELAGHAHGIVIDPVTKVLAGGSDPRSDGAAIGW